MHIFILGKDNKELAEAEALALSKKRIAIDENILLADSSDEIAPRLAYTSLVCRHLFSSTRASIKKDILKFGWQTIIKKDFWVRFAHSDGPKEAEYADLIWDCLKRPKASKESKTVITFIFTKKMVHVGVMVHEVDKKPLMDRRPHLKPEHSPTSLSPKLARAMVNLTGIKKGRVYDPFCGVGGIMIEAGLMGFKTVGYELDKKTYFKCKHNLDFYKVKDYSLKMKDALSIASAMQCVVTDLPYGRNSMVSQERDMLYRKFLSLLGEKLRGRACMMFPDDYDFRKALRKAGLKLEKEFTQYVHGSLTRHIVLISNPKSIKTRS